MEDWFSNPGPWIIAGLTLGLALLTAVITLSFFVLRAVWKTASWKTGVDLRLKGVDSELSSIKATLASFMTEVREDIKQIFKRLPSETVNDASPLQLTSKGQSISQALDAPRWAEDTATVLAKRVEGMVPYDIQEFCYGHVRDEFRPSPELEVKIKQCAYENALDRYSVLDVLAVELRDKLLPT